MHSGNEGFSLDEEYLAVFLNCVLAGLPIRTDSGIPESSAFCRITACSGVRIEGSRKDYKTLDGETRSVWNANGKGESRHCQMLAVMPSFLSNGVTMLRDPQSVWVGAIRASATRQRRAFETIEMGDGSA